VPHRPYVAPVLPLAHPKEDGTYGYCEETGEPISIKRLDARPIATLSIEAQERSERFDRFYRDE
jgi:DnaK suppressor protein